MGVSFFCFFPSRLGGWVVGVLCFPLFFLLSFAVLVAVAGWCGGCRGLPVVVWWLLSRNVVGCVVWLVVLLRCFAAPFFVVVASVVVVPGVRRRRCCCCCCCCLPFCCCCCCWCCRSSSASPSCGGRFPPRHDFSAGPCQATSSLPLGLPPPPNFDNIVLTHPVSAPISAFGPSVSSVLSCSGHGTALRTGGQEVRRDYMEGRSPKQAIQALALWLWERVPLVL